jgi:hypothetical protein
VQILDLKMLFSMKTVTIVFILFLIVLGNNILSAQSIERSVIGASGFSYSGPTFQADCTTGEAVISTFSGGGIILTQGFHQPLILDSFCMGDFDNNGFVNVADLLIFASTLGCVGSCGLPDLDSNGNVNITDLLIFISVFGNICP